jgi:hypothetical protein
LQVTEPSSVVELRPLERPLVVEDRKLIDRCLQGDSQAWHRLYSEFHGPLRASIKAHLRSVRPDPSLVDEIAARVWYLLVQNKFELLDRFEVGHGCRLTTFLSMLAKTQSKILFRSERRRRIREREAYRPEIVAPIEAVPYDGNLSEWEFVSTLTSAERAFYENVLVTPSTSSLGTTYDAPSISQLRHRIKKKLNHFLHSDDQTSQTRRKLLWRNGLRP